MNRNVKIEDTHWLRAWEGKKLERKRLFKFKLTVREMNYRKKLLDKIETLGFRKWFLAISESNSCLKFIYSEKATKFCEISTIDLTGTT